MRSFDSEKEKNVLSLSLLGGVQHCADLVDRQNNWCKIIYFFEII